MRQPGEVRDALLAVFREHQGVEISLDEIIKHVEARLGSSVAPSSVRSYLQIGTSRYWIRCDRRGYYKAR